MKNYTIKEKKLKMPKIKIVGVKSNKSEHEMVDTLRKQNNWIGKEDFLNIKYIKKIRNTEKSILFADCSPVLFHKMINFKKIYFDWEIHNVYEEYVVPRCYNCQGFHHKSVTCSKNKVCYECGEEHGVNSCSSDMKKCEFAYFLIIIIKTITILIMLQIILIVQLIYTS